MKGTPTGTPEIELREHGGVGGGLHKMNLLRRQSDLLSSAE
jgi:hypothetical protein